MKGVLPRETGLDARFDAELKAEIPGWRSGTAPDDVRHNVPARRFELETEGGMALTEYRLEEGRMIFTHTFVPPELRGRGLAERVVRAALAHARNQGLRVVPQCTYVGAFLSRHAEFAVLEV